MAHNSNRLPLKKITSLFTEEGLPRYYVGFEVEGVRSMDLAAGTILVEYSALVDWWDHKDLVEESTPSWTFRRCVTDTKRTEDEAYKKARPKYTMDTLVKYRKTQYGLIQLVFDPNLQIFPFDEQEVYIEMEFSSFQLSKDPDTFKTIRGTDLRNRTNLRTFRAFLGENDVHWAYRPLKSYEVHSGETPYATYPCVVGEARDFRTYTLSVGRGSTENEIYQVVIQFKNNPSKYVFAHNIPYGVSFLFITLLWVSGADATTQVALSNAVFNAGYYLASNPRTTNNQFSFVLCAHLVINEIFMFFLVAGAAFWKVLIWLLVVVVLSVTIYKCYRPVQAVSQRKPDYDAVSKSLKGFEKKEIELLFNAVDSGIADYHDFMNPTRLNIHGRFDSESGPPQDSQRHTVLSDSQGPPVQLGEKSALLPQP